MKQLNSRQKFKYRNSFFLLQVGVLVVLAVSCTKTPPSSSASHSIFDAQHTRMIRIQLVNEPMSLDPTLAEDGVSLQILNNIWDGLVGYSAAGQLENRIAESFQVSKDRKTYDFILRNEARWSDGRTVQPQDFITAFQRAFSSKTICKLAPLFWSIRGAKLYHQNKAPWESVGVKAEMRAEKNHLIFELDRPTSYFIHALTLPPAFPLREEVLKENQGRWPEKGPTTGSYQIISHELDRKMVLEPNLYSSGTRGSAVLAPIELQVVVDDSTALNLFERGHLDILTRVPSLDFPRLKKAQKVHTSSLLATYFLSFNCRKAPFNQTHWRRAVAGAVHRKEITDALASGEMSAWSWIPKGLEGYLDYRDEGPVFGDSIKWAKNHVKEVKAPLLAGFDTGSRNSRIMEKVQEDLRKNLGLSVSLMNLDWRSYGKRIQTDPPPLFRYGMLSPFMDPILHLKVLMSDDLNNYSGCSNKKYDVLVEEVEQLEPGAQREEKIKAAQKILLEEEAAVIPLFHYVQNTAVSPRIRGFQVNPFGVIQFKTLSLE